MPMCSYNNTSSLSLPFCTRDPQHNETKNVHLASFAHYATNASQICNNQQYNTTNSLFPPLPLYSCVLQTQRAQAKLCGVACGMLDWRSHIALL